MDRIEILEKTKSISIYYRGKFLKKGSISNNYNHD